MRTICGMDRVPASLLFDVVCARDVKSKPVFTGPVLWLTFSHCWFLLLLSAVSGLETGRKLTETQKGASFHFAWRLGKWFIGAKRWLVGTLSKRDRPTTNTDRTELNSLFISEWQLQYEIDDVRHPWQLLKRDVPKQLFHLFPRSPSSWWGTPWGQTTDNTGNSEQWKWIGVLH